MASFNSGIYLNGARDPYPGSIERLNGYAAHRHTTTKLTQPYRLQTAVMAIGYYFAPIHFFCKSILKQ